MTQYLNTERVAEILCISKESARKFMREMPHICIGGKAHETIRVTVSDFEQLYRQHLEKLYQLLGEPVPARLEQPVSYGNGHMENSGTMRRN